MQDHGKQMKEHHARRKKKKWAGILGRISKVYSTLTKDLIDDLPVYICQAEAALILVGQAFVIDPQ